MELKSVTLQLPEKLYRRLQQAANASRRSVEDVLRDSADIFYGDLSNEDMDTLLSELASYSTPQLWAVVYRGLEQDQAQRLSDLNTKNKRGQLIEAENAELDQLVDLVNRHMLLRSEALLLLKQRGQNIDSYLKTGK